MSEGQGHYIGKVNDKVENLDMVRNEPTYSMMSMLDPGSSELCHIVKFKDIGLGGKMQFAHNFSLARIAYEDQQ